MKSCKKCGEVKELDYFSRNRALADGFDNICRVCMKIKNAANYAKNADKRRAYAAIYTNAHLAQKSDYNKQYRDLKRPMLNEASRMWRQANPDKVANYRTKSRKKRAEDAKNRYSSDDIYRENMKARARVYRMRNPLIVASACARWQAEHAEDQKVYHRVWLKTVKGKELSKRLRERHWQARKLANQAYRTVRAGSKGELTNDDINQKFKSQNALCYYCFTKLIRKNWTIDHVIPLKRGGTNWASNVVLACGSCNSSKGARLYPNEWNRSSKNAS